MNTLTVRVKVPVEAAEAVLQSIKPEAESDAYQRSEVSLSYEDCEIVLNAKAGDLHAMRAAANTYIRWLDMCLKLTESK